MIKHTKLFTKNRLRTWQASWQILAVILAALQVARAPYHMNPDGMQYLDMGDAFIRGDWSMAVNAYWSPLYALIQGAARVIFQPQHEQAYLLAQLVNGAIFLIALAAYSFFLREVQKAVEMEDAGSPLLPLWMQTALAYALFIRASIADITVNSVTPDLLVSAFFYLITAMLIRYVSRGLALHKAALVGVLLGAAYLAKAPMFILALILLAALGVRSILQRQITPWVLMAGAFLITAGPWITLLSLQKDRFTFGESGRLNYAWYVNGVRPSAHWQGGPEENGIPAHPTQQLLSNPGIFSSDGPVGGTYPAWYDPTYWYEGLQVNFLPTQQIRTIDHNARVFVLFAWPVITLGALWPGAAFPDSWKRLIRWLILLLLPGAFMIAMYLLVHIEPRFVGGMLAVMASGAYIILRRRKPSNTWSRVIHLLTAASVVLVLAPVIRETIQIPQYRNNTPAYVRAGAVLRDEYPEVRTVGVIGNAFNAYWAQLAGVQITADLPKDQVQHFLELAPDERQYVMEAFENAGVEAVISRSVPDELQEEEWVELADTNFFLFRLAEN